MFNKSRQQITSCSQVKFWFFLSIFLNFACSILHLHIVHIYEIKTKEVKTLTISGELKFVLWCFHASSNFYANGCNLVNFVLSFAHIRTKGATIWSKLHTWCNWNHVCLSYDGIMFSLHYSKALPYKLQGFIWFSESMRYNC